ncbi:MAG: hypothetical protein Q8R30_02930 [bacterium]|nr:hypothetical protein [bacterium]
MSTQDEKDLALHYMTTLIEVARESFLILDGDLRVISANPTFYQHFRVLPEETENNLLYELGNGQWNIPELKKLMEGILPKKKVVKDFEVTHIFEVIGQKTILLNARQIDSVQLIILAMEDISVRKKLEEKLVQAARDLEAEVEERTAELTGRVRELELLNKSMVGRELKMVELKKEIEKLKKGAGNAMGTV